MLKPEDIQYLVNNLVAEIVPLLCRDYEVDYLTATEMLYRSTLYQKLQNPKCGLYFQSAGYVYSFWEDEKTRFEPIAAEPAPIYGK